MKRKNFHVILYKLNYYKLYRIFFSKDMLLNITVSYV